MITVRNDTPYFIQRINRTFYEYLDDPLKLKDLENFLNAMGIECKLVFKKSPDNQRELYFAHKK